MKRVLPKLSFVLLLLAPALASAQARILQFRSMEDPASPPDPAVCAAAPFHANVLLGGSLYVYETRASDGAAVTQTTRKIGHATACVQLTNFTFPAGLQQSFFVTLSLPDGDYTAGGTCTIVSNDTPQAGLVLAGCNLKLLAFPAGVRGGAVASLTTFNPFRLPGFTTGSYWTVQVYDAGREQGPDNDSTNAMQWEDDDAR